MHRFCSVIHTDIKPENIVFCLNGFDKFEMLYENVLNKPLVDIYEKQDKIILNKKQ